MNGKLRTPARVLALFVLIGNGLALAQSLPPGLTEEQHKKLDRFVIDYIKVIRVKERQPQPAFVKEFNDKYTQYCRQRAEAEYKKHGRWFYCEDHKEFGGEIRWDEVVTWRVYWQLYAHYGSLEKIPNYTKENCRKAVEFWRGWQKEDGSFYNLFTGAGNGPGCNGKYIPAIMEILGTRPPHKTAGFGDEKLDAAGFLKNCAANDLNQGMSIGKAMPALIDEGKTEYIPILERGIELALAHISPHTGMFHGPAGNPRGGAWSGYGTTANTMKGLGRMIGYMGIENMPYRHVRADTLIKNQELFRAGQVSVKRNTAEMFVQCLLESSYRQEELLQALDAHSEVLMSERPWQSHIPGDYCAYSLMMFGPYLHWEGYEKSAPRIPFYQGAAYDRRVVIGPFGRCANVIRKKPEELLWDKDWSYGEYGLRARNEMHEKRTVIDVVPASSDGWVQSKDEQGRIILARKFILEKTNLENPYLKMEWSGGDIEILINNIPVRKKLGGLAGYGAVHITPEARESLHSGENTVMIRTMSAAQGALQVSAGLIDWRGPGS